MGSKNRPGRFDCYVAAEPDEPMFTLLGRDRWGAFLTTLWANIRRECGEPDDVVDEAVGCAADMARWCYERGREVNDEQALVTVRCLIDATDTWVELLRSRGYDVELAVLQGQVVVVSKTQEGVR